MKLKAYIVILIAFALSGCATTSARIASNLSVKEFNSIASKYYGRPTFVSITTKSDNSKSLLIEVDTYKIKPYGMNSFISFSARHADTHISYINKYLKWEEIAVNDGDILDKKIGKAPYAAGLPLSFSFYSSNERSHYLVISNCDLMCSESSDHHYYDKANAIKLKELLISLKSDKFIQQDLSEKYN